MKTRRKKLAVTILTAALLGLLLLPQTRVGLKTLGAALNLLVPQGNWRPLQWLTRAPLRQQEVIKSINGRSLTIFLFEPAGAARQARNALLIYTPLIGPGPEDPRLVNLASTFARAGFVAAIPWRGEEQQIITPQDVDDVVSTALFLKNNPQWRVERLGLMGLSYGNGPVIVAAADPRLKESVSFVVSFAGYFDILNAAHFVQSGEFSYEEARGNLAPDPYAKEILNKTLNHYGIAPEKLFESAKFGELRRALSPAQFIDQLKAEFFILHSTDDRYIPYTESLRLRDALLGRVPVNFALTTIFEHGDYKKLTWGNLRGAYLPTALDFYKFLYRMFSR